MNEKLIRYRMKRLLKLVRGRAPLPCLENEHRLLWRAIIQSVAQPPDA